MRSITIHGLDDPLDARIREKARKEGLSLNKTIKKLLAEALGLEEPASQDRRREFSDLFGLLSKEEAQALNARTRTLRRIDPEDWA